MDKMYLKEIAYNFLCSQKINSFSINVFDLLAGLKIRLTPCKAEDPILENQDMVSILCADVYNIFYQKTLKMNDYRILYEFSKFLLKQNGYSNVQNSDRELLVLFIMAPPIILRELHLTTVYNISKTCNTPAHITQKYLHDLIKDENNEYSLELKNNFKKYIHNHIHKASSDYFWNKVDSISEKLIKKEMDNPDPKLSDMKEDIKETYNLLHMVYLDPETKLYHEYDCPGISDKIDITTDSIDHAKRDGYTACPECINQ